MARPASNSHWDKENDITLLSDNENTQASGWFAFSPPCKALPTLEGASIFESSAAPSHRLKHITIPLEDDHSAVSNIETVEEEIPTLKVSRFAASPWINFGSAKYYPKGPAQTPLRRTLNVENPGEREETLVIEKLSATNGFGVEQEKLTIPPLSTVPLVFTWTPTSIGNARENVTLKGSNFRLRAMLFATGTEKLGMKNIKVNIEIMAGTNENGEKQVYTSSFIKTQETDDAVAIAKSKEAAKPKPRPAVFTSTRRVSVASTPKNSGATSRLANRALELRTPSQKTSVNVSLKTPSSSASSLTTTSDRSSQKRPSTTTLGASVIKKRKIGEIGNADELKTPSKRLSSAQIQQQQSQVLESAVKNLFKKYASDGRWMEKQESAFVKWLNFVLSSGAEASGTPSEHSISSTTLLPVTSAANKKAITPKQLSFLKRKSHVRQSARSFFMGSESQRVLSKLQAEVVTGKIVISAEKFIWADLGLRQHVTNLLLSNYAPHHLHLALEIFFGEVIPGPISSTASYSQALESVLGKFIVKRLLFDDATASQFEGLVKELYKPGFKEALDKLVLYRFLALVWLLDRFKTHGILEENTFYGISSPNVLIHQRQLSGCVEQNATCLFKKTSSIKSSNEILTTFASNYLSGEGDILRRMSLIHYTLHHQQTYLDEFDFSVNSLAADLRDGIRLSRLAEILSRNPSLGISNNGKGSQDSSFSSSQLSLSSSSHSNHHQSQSILHTLRVPAISRLQKIHNVTQALNKLRQCGVMVTELDPRDIVDGKQSKTLGLLWQVLLNAQLPHLVSVDKIRVEVERITRHNLITSIDAEFKRKPSPLRSQSMTEESDPSCCVFFNSDLFSSILQWTQVICARYGVSIQNFTTSFSDGRAFCYLIHYYAPEILDANLVQQHTSTKLEEKLSAALSTSNTALSGALTSSTSSSTLQDVEDHGMDLLDLDEMPTSPGLIDGNWVGVFSPPAGTSSSLKAVLEAEKHNYNLLNQAIKKIGFVPQLANAFDMSNTLPDEKVVVTFLTFLCARLTEIVAEREATITIQRAFRVWYSKSTHVREARAAVVIQAFIRSALEKRKFLALKKAAVTIQSAVRAKQARYHVMKLSAALKIQAWWRMVLAKRRLQQLQDASLKIQSWWRMILAKKEFERKTFAALVIQKHRRTVLAQRSFHSLQNAAIILQSAIRAHHARIYANRTRAALTIQSWWRMILVQRHVSTLQSSALKIQSWWRMIMAKRHFQQLETSALAIQTAARALSARRLVTKMETSATIIQSWFRMRVAQRQFQAYQLEKRSQAALKIQAWWRRILAQKAFHEKQTAALKIQSWWRMILARKTFQAQQAAALKVQSWWRMVLARKSFHVQQTASLKIQSWWRMVLAKRNFAQLQQSAIIIQSAIRARNARVHAERVRSALKIQSWWRMVLVKKEVARQQSAALKIQSWWRMVMARKSFNEQTCAALRIQSWWRMVLAKRHMARLESSAITIQSAIRARQARIHMERTRASLKIQSWWRMIMARKSFAIKESAALKIQSWWRMILARKSFKIQESSALKIQSWWRMILARQHFSRLQHSAITLQTAFRSRHAVKRVEQMTRAVSKISATFRGHVQREETRTIKLGIARLQALVRSKQAREQYEEMKRQQEEERRLKWAAEVVQKRWREKLASRNQLTIEKAVLRIQALYKGFRVRRDAKLARIAVLRAKIAHSRATTPISQSLGFRTNAALKVILEGTKLTDIVSACTVLEQATRYSDTCARYVIEVEAIKILFGVMETCNRSAPHISVLKIILDVVTHICSWRSTRSGLVQQQTDVLERIVSIMSNFKDVPEVFNRASAAFLAITKPLPETLHAWLAPANSGAKLNLGRITSLEEHIHKRLTIEKRAKKPANILALSQDSYNKIAEISQMATKWMSGVATSSAPSKPGLKALPSSSR